ncbi:MAG: hypothetical protein J6U56_06250 [Spirochaetia bacterium]|jgi:hypothetical protein|nr:hypothetical protein [Spirochaetia bacterium]
MAIYDKQELISPSFFQRLLKLLPKENYIIEVQNLLAENNNNILLVNKEKIDYLNKKYKVKKDDFKQDREILLDKYISYCLYDRRLSDIEKSNLKHLCDLLSLDEDYLINRIKEEGKIIYREKVKDFISDNVLSSDERKELDLISNEFNLLESEGDDIYKDESFKLLKKHLDDIMQKRRVSPEDEEIIYRIAKGLKLELKFADDLFERFKNYWLIENRPLQPVLSSLNLSKNELLYYSTKIEWFEERSKTNYVSYSGLTGRIRIVKGLYLRVGSIAPSRHANEYMKLIDSGDVYFTNKRIIFIGNHGNKTIPMTRILDIIVFANGIEIGKDAGKRPFFKCDDPELMGIYILRILKDL